MPETDLPGGPGRLWRFWQNLWGQDPGLGLKTRRQRLMAFWGLHVPPWPAGSSPHSSALLQGRRRHVRDQHLTAAVQPVSQREAVLPGPEGMERTTSFFARLLLPVGVSRYGVGEVSGAGSGGDVGHAGLRGDRGVERAVYGMWPDRTMRSRQDVRG